jgi:hypothetical protein
MDLTRHPFFIFTRDCRLWLGLTCRSFILILVIPWLLHPCHSFTSCLFDPTHRPSVAVVVPSLLPHPASRRWSYCPQTSSIIDGEKSSTLNHNFDRGVSSPPPTLICHPTRRWCPRHRLAPPPPSVTAAASFSSNCRIQIGPSPSSSDRRVVPSLYRA